MKAMIREKIMSNVKLLVGNIGTGKSILAHRFALEGDCVVSMDTIQAMCAGGNYGMYDFKKSNVYHAAEDAMIEAALKTGLNVVIDRTNIDTKTRRRFIDLVKPHTDHIRAYDFGPGDVRTLHNRIRDPRGVPQETWNKVHQFMQEQYVKPSLEEGFSSVVDMPEKYQFYAFDFDGTITQNYFPDIGPVINETIAKMKDLWKSLENIIIIWTCRSGDYENKMRAFLLENKTPFHFINENPMFSTGSKKIFAHEYYDDRNKEVK